MGQEYRLIHFNCARPLGEFTWDNDFVKIFASLIPRVFKDANESDGLIWHVHGARRETGEWRGITDVFPHPEGMPSPHVCTMAGWRSLEDLKQFSYSGRTHPPSMRRLSDQMDRSEGANFVLWWAPKEARFTLEDGWQKLQHLRLHGSTPEAFSIDSTIPKPAAA